ncbi:MAG: DEAD/DEAH box helicase family protein [Aestuariibacter sp.]|nr:DEAD/DEAH box helicase family protein [Aestuariibacter sp.]
MINPKAIDGFIRANRDDWRWIKKASLEELEETFADVPVHTTPYKHQWASIALGVSNPAFMYFLDMGLGKAQATSEPVLTPNGWIAMGDIKAGDYVIGGDGNAVLVTDIHPQGKLPIYKVTFSDGSSTTCCDDHLWATNTAVRNRRGQPHKVSDLRTIKADLRDKAGNCKHYIPMTAPVQYAPVDLSIPLYLSPSELGDLIGISGDAVIKWDSKGNFAPDQKAGNARLYKINGLSERMSACSHEPVKSRAALLAENMPASSYRLDPYILGVLLGDGSLSKSIRFTSVDEEIIEYVREALPDGCVITKYTEIDYGISGNSKGATHGNPLLQAARHWDLIGKNSNNKHIPEPYLRAPVADRVALLQGLLDTDGYVSTKGTVQFSSNSIDLIKGVRNLVQSLGGVARQSKKSDVHTILTLNLPEWVKPFRLTRKQERVDANSKKYHPSRAIVSVELIGEEDAQCITVANSDGLYITNDFIVTHNTKLLLDLFMYRRKLGQAKRALVLVPNFTNIQSWVDEIQVHQPELVGIGLEGSAKQRKELLEAEGDVWIINYQGLQSLVTKTENRRRTIDEEALEYTASLFDMVAMDEIHKCKNPESLTFEICDVLCQAAKFRYGLTGTPFGRNPMDLWAQFFLIDRGESLSHHPQIFKETFFDQKVNGAGFMDWEFNKKKKRLLNRMIQHRSIRYRDSECMDLPSQNFIPVRVGMGKDALKYMREMLDEIQQKAMAGDALDDRKNAENVFMKMRTLASGFVRVYELDDDGKKTKNYEDIIFKDQPKLDALTDLIESLPEGEKIVIFHEFIATGNMIEAALKKSKIKYLALNAQTKDKKAFLHDFRENKSITAAVVNSKSGSTGLNLQTANHMAFFESPVSPIERQQAEKRTHRGGQKKPCFYYDLITINSVDERIQEFIKEGKDLMTEIVEQKSSMLLGMMGEMVSDEKARTSKKKKK